MATKHSNKTIEGMGSIVLSEGVAFRVWAPNAEFVSVIGDFNEWQSDQNPMQREEGGTWYAWVEGATEGQSYLYHIKYNGNTFTRPDPRARVMENSVGNSIIWQPKPELAGESFVSPTLDKLIIYEMHIGSFHVPEDRKLGDFATAAEKLPYLNNLGINAIEIMPVAEFAGDFSWGYNPANPYSIERAYGGPEGLLQFVKACHEHGIAVIMDVVYNHFGPSDLGLWQFDGWSENDKGGIYFYNDHRSTTPWGDTRPDYGRGEVRTYIRDNALMWFDEYKVDGLRWDMSLFIRTIGGNPHDPNDEIKEGWGLMQWINHDVRVDYPSAITIAEDLQDNEYLVKDIGIGGGGFSSQWHAAFVHPVRETMIQTEDQHRNLDAIIHALTQHFDDYVFKRVIYSESHDEVANGKARLPSEISPEEPDALPAIQRSNLAAVLVYTAPGVPMIFQGQEFLTDEWFRDDVPLDWSKPETYQGVVRLYSDLAKLRLNHNNTTGGLTGQFIEVHHVDYENNVIGFRRWREGGAGDEVIVIVNLANNSVEKVKIGVAAKGVWKVRFTSDCKIYAKDLPEYPCNDATSLDQEWDGQPYSIEIGLGAYAAVILSQDSI